MKIEEFIDEEYREYATYVLQSRAIPNLIDGLKPSQRKILYTALKTAKNNPIKTASLSGNCIYQANYHHGDASLNAAISAMAADWNNNLPLLDGIGNFGSRLVNAPAAARYTLVQVSKNFERFFVDNDILETAYDPEDPEPNFYLPLIPWILVNGIRGIAIGFASEIQPRDPKAIIGACKAYLKSGRIANDIPPHFESFKGAITWDKKTLKHVAHGRYDLSGLTLTIDEIPPGIERETYVKHLNKLEDSGFISSFIDESQDGYKFVIRLPNKTKLSHDQIMSKFKLLKNLNENLTVIDENGKLKVFQSAIEILKHFCDYRVKIYDRRFKYYIKRDQQEVDRLSERLRFIQLVVDGKLKFTNKTKKDLKDELINKRSFNKGYIPDLMEVKTYHFCDDEIQSIKERISDLEKDLIQWKNAVPKDVFIAELTKMRL